MSMTSNEIKKRFDKLLAYETTNEKWDTEAKLLISQFISEILSVMDSMGIKRNELAKQIGTSSSFITQLFRGNKLINFITLAKIQEALNIRFQVKLKKEEPAFSFITHISEEEGVWLYHKLTGDNLYQYNTDCLGEAKDVIAVDKMKEVA